jgi:hypothetical protein
MIANVLTERSVPPVEAGGPPPKRITPHDFRLRRVR